MSQTQGHKPWQEATGPLAVAVNGTGVVRAPSRVWRNRVCLADAFQLLALLRGSYEQQIDTARAVVTRKHGWMCKLLQTRL